MHSQTSILLVISVLLITACGVETIDNAKAQVSPDATKTIAQTAKAATPPNVAKAKPSAETPRVYIISPAPNAIVGPTFKVVFGLSGMGIAPAGIDKDNTGHHHLLIDLDELPDMSFPLPATENIVHFGGGQTETWVTLAPGQHTLQLLLGDFAHRPHGTPIISEKITVTITEE